MSVVVPAYDEADRIATTVDRLRTELADLDPEVVVVDDGSRDATAAEARRAGARVVALDRHRGKGAAVRAGALAAEGAVVVVTDADLAYAPDQLRPFVDAVEAGTDLAVGNRSDERSATVGRRPASRAVASRVFNLVTAGLLAGRYRDTQCGCKAFAAPAARQVFGRAGVDGFAFDVEVLHVAERLGLAIAELPVRVSAGGASTVRLWRAGPARLRDLWRVRRWSRGGRYDERRDEGAAEGAVEGIDEVDGEGGGEGAA
ncbi:MAG: glycosyltransferase [Acidimicrobiia bacterium]